MQARGDDEFDHTRPEETPPLPNSFFLSRSAFNRGEEV
jgi:hypothetical protein